MRKNKVDALNLIHSIYLFFIVHLQIMHALKMIYDCISLSKMCL